MASATSSPNRAAALPRPRLSVRVRADVANLILIALAFAAIVLLISPARSYPITDDWIYSQSVSELTRLSYKPHDWTQPIAIGHLMWGGIGASIFGNSFTLLTCVNLAISLACLFTFYALLRQLGVLPRHALLGVAILGVNPLYVYVSFSFMTDVTFLLYTLVACLCYLRGLEGRGHGWLWLGGLATALAYLTRQYGILVLVAALAYLWLSRCWTWRQAAAIGALPLVAAGAYAMWERFQPEPLITLQMDLVREVMMEQPLRFLNERVARIVWGLPLVGLSLLPLLKLPRRAIWAMPAFLVIVFYQFQSLRIAGSVLPPTGNIVDNTGFLMYSYQARPIWSEPVWAVLAVLGGLVFSFYLLTWVRGGLAQVKERPWLRLRAPGPAFVPCAYATITAIAVLVATPFLFDRYWLGLLPACMIPPLLRLSTERRGEGKPQPARASTALRWAALAPIAAFSLLGIRDFKEHSEARWQAALDLVARGVPASHIRAGNEWESWHNFAQGAQTIRDTGDLTHIFYPPDVVIDPEYMLSDTPVGGYEIVATSHYRSWLEAGAERQVLVQKRK